MTAKKLDCKNQECPRPMIATMSTIKTLEKGEVLTMETTDQTTREAIPKLCERAGFTLVEVSDEGEVIRFTIRK